MDLTPPHDFKFEKETSTPLTHLPSSRKRKLNETLDFSLSSPKFSSTFNESLISNFNECNLVDSCLCRTPEKQLKLSAKNAVVASPIQESRKILYSSIRSVKPEKKFAPRVKYVSYESRKLLDGILNINVIMNVIFKYLSGGDLYRFSLVSQSFYQALVVNETAFQRYKVYKELFKDNKENYVITPPGSPDKSESPPRTVSDNLNKFIRIAKSLKRLQTLDKCRKCSGVSIVEKDVSQCQNVNSCGLIMCLLCSSSSETGPANFKDYCGHATLRPKLGNVSNTMKDSFFNFSSQDSGFCSENDSSTPNVRRNLFSTSTNCSSAENSRVLTTCNKNRVVVVRRQKKEPVSFVEVVPNEQTRKAVDCDSPPRYIPAVGSKQSKKNLKRLTR